MYIQNQTKLCVYILSIMFPWVELYAGGAMNRIHTPFCKFVINIWNRYVLTCSGGVIMLLVSKCKCELFEIMW